MKKIVTVCVVSVVQSKILTRTTGNQNTKDLGRKGETKKKMEIQEYTAKRQESIADPNRKQNMGLKKGKGKGSIRELLIKEEK